MFRGWVLVEDDCVRPPHATLCMVEGLVYIVILAFLIVDCYGTLETNARASAQISRKNRAE